MIHYHGTPFTPRADMLNAFPRRHAFVSYSDPRDIEVAAEICQSVAIDNGAFHAWKKGIAYDFSGYLDWVRLWMGHPAVDWCVIPDVIDGTEWDNMKLINAWPLPKWFSVPVYHMHESTNHLQQLVARFGRVAIGSSGAYSNPGTPGWWDRMHEIMPIVCNARGQPMVKLHGLRMLDPDIFSLLPLNSADSTNVARNAGIDGAWNGPYAPPGRADRALIMMNRIESHASAPRWNPEAVKGSRNYELLG